MANPPNLKPGNWGVDQTLFLTITKTGSKDPFVYDGENDKGKFWIWRVEVEGGSVDQEFGRERSLFPGDYLHDVMMKLHAQRAFQVGTKLAITKAAKDGGGHTWIVEFAGEQPEPSGASVQSRPPAQQPPPQQQQRRPATPAAADPYKFPTRDKFATPVYTLAQAEAIARWAVRLADTVAAPGEVERVEDSRIIINTDERSWNDERARQSNIATWVILAKDIIPTEFGASYGPPPDLEAAKGKFWSLVRESDADPKLVGEVLIDRFEPTDGDGARLTVWNYMIAIGDIETIVREAIDRHVEPEPDPEPDPQVDPEPVEDVDEPEDAGITDADIPFGY